MKLRFQGDTMCYRVYTKPDSSHEWLVISECTTPQEALDLLESLVSGPKHRNGKWLVRNTRGEIIARATVADAPAPCTFWTMSQVLCV